MRSLRNLLVLMAVGAVFFAGGYRLGEKRLVPANSSTNNVLDLSLMWQVRDRLKEIYLDKEKIKDKEMTYGAIEGLVASLDDPYTVFLPPKENKLSTQDLAGEFGGVGISLGYKDKNLAVMSPLPKTPAEKAGLRAGDLIVKIIDKNNSVDKDTTGISLDEAVNLIRGKIGTEVVLKIYREGKNEPFEVTLKRENIVVPSLELEMVTKNNKSVAWVKLYKFSERIYEEWPTVVEEINGEKNLAGVVLDLRNNPGGFLQASVVVASDLLESGVVVTQASSGGKEEQYKVDETKRQLTKPKLVVLVNGGSASAAEILAGALKYYGRGKLVGEKTFGKGTVQQPEELPDGSGLHVTVAKWLLPDGKNIHGVGVDPDVVVKYEAPKNPESKVDNQFDKAVEELLK
ncbi:MAG: S41 family peptidase [Candidatus Shapirobacteria bacterium]|jgi:carboxyl-terminal processing protease